VTSNSHVRAEQIRAALSHPVVDADGHWLEFGPSITAALGKIGGEDAVRGYTLFGEQMERELEMSVAERRFHRIGQQGFWAVPTRNTRDRATAMMPRLLYERMDELGLDFCVLYPTAGLGLPRLTDRTLRRAACRAFNIYVAEQFAPFADRFTPIAAIPTYTPDEAIEELEFVKRELGLKAVMLGSMNRHAVPALAPENEQDRFSLWRDVLGLDSDHDYDPVWQCCQDLGFSPTFHTGGRGYGLRLSPTNFVYNHIGHFASTAEAVCKALFLGGVTRRFPRLNFGFQEGGVGWACQLFSDLVEHWETRNLEALAAVDPANVDANLLLELAQEYGDAAMIEALRDPATIVETAAPASAATGCIGDLDDFSACQIEKPEDLSRLFADRFYFGCESEDRMNAWGFAEHCNPFRVRLNAMFGSDIGHFDVMEMEGVLPGAYALVEDGLMTATDFRDFAFANAVRFWGETNPDFFEGTVVANEATAVLKSE
jgi:predicted TIM-barrel fold metal-dependent hydrolase